MDGALVINGMVDTVARDIAKLSDMPEVASGTWIEAPAGQVFGGFRYEGGKFLPPAVVSPPVTAEQVDAERDRRIEAGFAFAGTKFQSRQVDRENILGAASLAHMSITLSGAKPGDLRWHGGASDFVWIAADNSLVPMDAPTMIAFGKAAAEHKSAHTFAARALKDADPIPADFADDRHWPERA